MEASSTARKESSDMIQSVPIDIALLHIETDALLDSLRNSAITPSSQEPSPTGTESTDSTCMQTYLETDALAKDAIDDNRIAEDDEFSIDSDDGMRGEIQKLHKATSEINKSLANFSAQRSKSIVETTRIVRESGDCDNVAQRHQETDDVFSVLVKEILMVCEEIFMLFIRSPSIQTILRSKAFQKYITLILSRPREWVFIYVLFSAVFHWIKHKLTNY